MKNNIFSKYNLEDSYWAGFIAADGTIHKNGYQLNITLQEKDRDQLEYFKFFSKTKSEIKRKQYIKSFKPENIYYSIDIYSKEICYNLYKNYNITSNKSLTYSPPNMDILNKLCFLVGYIDGDGSITYNKYKSKKYPVLAIAGTYKTINWIKKVINIVLDRKVKFSVNKNGETYVLRFTGKNVLDLYDYVDVLPISKMRRKWNRLIPIRKTYGRPDTLSRG